MTIKEQKQLLLDRLYEPYKKCLECPLGYLGRKNIVFGKGDPDARLMIIGEAPGKNEDEQAEPFVGKSGKFLTKILLSLDIQRSDIFITNIVKCRPPNNRKPEQLEIKTCTNLLLFKQIAIIQPHVICTLGSVALEGLLHIKTKMSSIRGTILQHDSIPVIPTFHPAYVIRTQKTVPLFTEDIQKAFIFSQK